MSSAFAPQSDFFVKKRHPHRIDEVECIRQSHPPLHSTKSPALRSKRLCLFLSKKGGANDFVFFCQKKADGEKRTTESPAFAFDKVTRAAEQTTLSSAKRCGYNQKKIERKFQNFIYVNSE
jgi:hypothetical protein